MLPTTASPFVLGVNYPWIHYGQDFGQTATEHTGVSILATRQIVAEDFARIRECGATVVRWFVFGDGRAGFLCDDGIPQRPDSFLIPDLAAALEVAAQCELKICFSLIDYLWLQDRGPYEGEPDNHKVLQFAAGREAFLENVLLPVFRDFRGHPGLFAWEIANEPEWAIREFHPIPEAKMHIADFRAFATEIARAVHEFGNVPVTLGSARLLWTPAWREVGLDFYQAHFYPGSETEGGDIGVQLATIAKLDKPLWVGELPASDSATAAYSLFSALDACREAELHGAAVWRWRKPEPSGTDLAVGCVDAAALKAWNKSERAHVRRAEA
jgi:hypothetical protein